MRSFHPLAKLVNTNYEFNAASFDKMFCSTRLQKANMFGIK